MQPNSYDCMIQIPCFLTFISPPYSRARSFALSPCQNLSVKYGDQLEEFNINKQINHSERKASNDFVLDVNQ